MPSVFFGAGGEGNRFPGGGEGGGQEAEEKWIGILIGSMHVCVCCDVGGVGVSGWLLQQRESKKGRICLFLISMYSTVERMVVCTE